MKQVTFEEYISDYQIVSVNNVDLIDKCGLTSVFDELDGSGTCFLMAFNHGGYIQLNFEGTFVLVLGSFQYADSDWRKIVRHLYDWCDGEYFEAVTAASQTIAEIDALLAEYPREVK